MSTHKRRLNDINNSGFGPNSNVEGSRLTNKDGSTNLKKIGLPFWNRISIYHTLLRMKSTHFLFCILLLYTSVNIFFAIIYYFIGVQNLVGVDNIQRPMHQLMEAFFFSSQTLTTVGYGAYSPFRHSDKYNSFYRVFGWYSYFRFGYRFDLWPFCQAKSVYPFQRESACCAF